MRLGNKVGKRSKQRASMHPQVMKFRNMLKKKQRNNPRATFDPVLLLIVDNLLLRDLEKPTALRHPPRYATTYVISVHGPYD